MVVSGSLRIAVALLSGLSLAVPARAGEIAADVSVVSPVTPVVAPAAPLMAPSLASPALGGSAFVAAPLSAPFALTGPALAAPAAPTASIALSPAAALAVPKAVAAQLSASPAGQLAAAAAATPALSALPPAAAAPAAAAAANGKAPTARAQIDAAAAPLAAEGTDVAGHLARVYDSAGGRAEALTAVVPAAANESSSRRASGLSPAAAPALVERTFQSPAGAEAFELNRLDANLAKIGAPPHKTRVDESPLDDSPTVAILAPASLHKLSIVAEGGRQSPGDVNLVLDAAWLIQQELPDGRTRLLMKKGLSFDAHGQATIVEYKTPRVVRYFADYFTLGSNDRSDGVPFERNLDVPQSNSLQLETFVNDKLRMSLLGAENGVEVPAMLTFAMPQHPLAGEPVDAGRVAVAPMPHGADKAAALRRRIDAFLDRYEGAEIVVKPSGPQFHSARGVKFFRADQRDEIAAHALELSNSPMMTQDGAVIVTGRVDSAPLLRDGRKSETTLRVLAARTPSGGAVTTDIFARVGPWGKPTTAEAADPRDNAVVEPWEQLLKDWNLTPAQAKALDARVRAMGATMLQAIMKMEKGLKRPDGGAYQAQTDMIGLDVMIERRGSTLVPVMIEVNDHDSGGQYNLDMLVAKERVGTHSREWIATMLQRARRDALKGKRIVIVGAGYQGKRFVFERAKELGVKIILIDKPTTWAKDLVSELIPTDNTKPAEALAEARKKLLASARKNGKIDGITTFWEDDVELTADIARELGLPYHTQAAATTARSKFQTQEVLDAAGVPAARRAVVGNLSTADDHAEHVAMLQRFRAAAERVGFPAVLKPVSGAEAIGTERVNDIDEAVAAYERISALVNPRTDPVFATNSDLLLMQYLNGHEYDVDLVMRNGEVMFESITDNKPTREPSFLATGSRLPSILSAADQRAAIDQAIASARALGLNDGVIHMEGKVTSEGPRLIEANARMGGSYVRDWVLQVWGVDMVEEGFMAATGVGGRPFKPAQPLTHLDGDFINSDKHGIIRVIDLPEAARKMPGFVRFRKVMHEGEVLNPEKNGGYARVAMLEVGGATAEEARRNLEAIKAKIRFEIDPVR
jgi:carnosine synthase